MTAIIASQFLEELMAECDENSDVELSDMDGSDIEYLDRVESPDDSITEVASAPNVAGPSRPTSPTTMTTTRPTTMNTAKTKGKGKGKSTVRPRPKVSTNSASIPDSPIIDKEKRQWQECTEGSTDNLFRFLPPRPIKVNRGILAENSTPIQCLLSLYNGDIMNGLVTSINEYAEQKCAEKADTATPRSVFKTWKPITLGELYKYLSVIINMGIDQKPAIPDYFSLEPTKYTPWFRQMFKRDRFQAIYHTMMHVGEPVTKGKAKIEPFVNSLLERFQEVYYPVKNLAVDEMVIGWKGRWAHKQYNASKPKKYHVKTFGLCDSETGYVVNLLIYFGTDTSYDPECEDESQAVKVFDTLLKPCSPGHHIFSDRYYTSYCLLEYLAGKKFLFTGTVNTNRKGFPPEIKTEKIGYREMKWFMEKENKHLCVMFRDKKAKKSCTLVSSDAKVATVNKKDVDKPEMIDLYNSNMNGCDRADQCMQTYGTYNRRTKKWWKKIFLWIFEIAQVNAFILFAQSQSAGSKKLTFLKFKTVLVNSLADLAVMEGLYVEAIRVDDRGHVRPEPLANRLAGNHVIAKSTTRLRVCRYCSTREKVKRTSFYCKDCESEPFLHPNNCFEMFHSRR
jgi:hypothetical protein